MIEIFKFNEIICSSINKNKTITCTPWQAAQTCLTTPIIAESTENNVSDCPIDDMLMEQLLIETCKELVDVISSGIDVGKSKN